MAHFLLGFDLKSGVGRSELQSAQANGVRTPLHAVLGLLAGAEAGCPAPLTTSRPRLAVACYQLVASLAAHPTTAQPTLRYLRSCNFLPAQLSGVAALAKQGTVHAARSTAWLLRTLGRSQ